MKIVLASDNGLLCEWQKIKLFITNTDGL